MPVRTEVVDEHILLVTIDRPEVHNAMDRDTLDALQAVWQRLRDEPALRVGVVTGAGDHAFSTGADLATLIPELVEGDGPVRAVITLAEMEVWKPVIAAINGYCLAGALGLALACDVRIAVPAARFGTMGVRRGIIPGAGQSQRLPRMVGLGNALRLLLTGDMVDADEALRIGLVQEVVPADRLLERALQMARTVVGNAPLAVQATKRAAVHGLGMPLQDGLGLEARLSAEVRRTEDAREGVRAFRERREPRFVGQ